MATILAHLEIKPGKEAEWEAIMADMVRQTFEPVSYTHLTLPTILRV